MTSNIAIISALYEAAHYKIEKLGWRCSLLLKNRVITVQSNQHRIVISISDGVITVFDQIVYVSEPYSTHMTSSTHDFLLSDPTSTDKLLLLLDELFETGYSSTNFSQ